MNVLEKTSPSLLHNSELAKPFIPIEEEKGLAEQFINTAQSPLRQPRKFFTQALHDFRGAHEVGVRMFKQTIAQKYRYSSLGLLWAFAPSALTAVILSIGQRANVTALQNNAIPPQLYAVFGIVMAQTFLDAMTTQRTLFGTHRHLLSRHRVPLEGLILAGFYDNVFNLAMKLILLVFVFLFCWMLPSPQLPLGIIGLAAILLIGTAVGLLLAPWNALKKDLDNGMIIFPWAFFALTPIFVRPSSGNVFKSFYKWNPFSYLFDATRHLSYGTGTGHIENTTWNLEILLVTLAICVVLLPVSWLLCRIARPYVVESFLL